MLIRVLAVAVLLFSILFMPFWLSAVLAILAMLYFPIFWEAVALFLLSDLLYGTKEVKFYGMVFVSTVIATLIILVIEFLKKKLKFYP